MNYTSLWKPLALLACALLLPLAGYAEAADPAIPESLLSNPNIADIEVYHSHASYDPTREEDYLSGPHVYKGDNGLWGLESLEGVRLTDPVWDNIRNFDTVTSYFSMEKDGKWGFIDKSGAVVTEPQYKEIKGVYAPMYETVMLRILTFEDKYGLLTPQLETVLPTIYSYINEEIFENTLEVGRDYGFTIADLSGKELVPLQPDWVHKTSSPNYYICGTADKGEFYLIDSAGNRILNQTYQSIEQASDATVIIQENGLKGMIDLSGNVLIPCRYVKLTQPVYGGALLAYDGESGGYFDAYGRMIGGRLWPGFEPTWYEGRRSPSLKPEELLFPIQENGKYGYLNYQGDMVAQPVYERVNGRFVQLGGKTGLLANDGSYLVEPKWEIAPDRFTEYDGFYTVSIEGDIGSEPSEPKTGLLNRKGEVVIEPIGGMFYTGVHDWLFFQPLTEMQRPVSLDNSDSVVFHLTLKEQTAPLSDELLQSPPLLTAAVDALTSQGILTGDKSGDLNLASPVSRAEFLAMLARADGWTDTDAAASFADTQGHWAEGIISSAVSRGLVTGYTDALFGPEDAVTARQALTILFRAQHCPEYVLSDDWMFSDAFSYSRLTMGRGFDRDAVISRKDAVILLYSYQKSDVDLSTHDFEPWEVWEGDPEAVPSFYL